MNRRKKTLAWLESEEKRRLKALLRTRAAIRKLLLANLGELRLKVRGRAYLGLSPMEKRVLEAAMRSPAEPYKALVDGLCVSLSTVRFHMARIFRKCGVKNRQELNERFCC